MAMINRIRKRSGLLIIMIGGAMVAFLMGDLFRGGGAGCQRQGPQRNQAGSIYGESIPQDRYRDRVRERVQQVERREGSEVDSEMRERIRDQVWNEMVRERIFGKHIEELGIEVPSAELKDLLAGENVHPRIRRIFEQQTGSFDPRRVLQQIAQTFQNDPEARQQWTRMARNIMKDRSHSKFTDLVKKAMYANSVEVRDAYEARNRSIDAEFVLRPYRELSDDDVDVSEKEVRDHYEEHKDDKEYEQEGSRSFEYVVFDASPSEADIREVRKDVMTLKEEFIQADNDSLFAARVSDREGKVVEYLRRGELEDPKVDSTLFASDTGDVIGPFRDEGNRFQLYKALEVVERPDSVKASHILLNQRGNSRNSDSLRRVADSLKGELRAGADFGELAQQFSRDPGSAQQGGDLGWIRPGEMLSSFDETTFNADTGEMPIVETQAGIHLIRIENRTRPVLHYRTAVVEKEARPSEGTLDSAYNKASQLAIGADGPDDFDRMVEENGYSKRLASRIKESDRSIARLEDSRQLIRWAYNSESGEVSKATRCGDNYVVGLLTEVRKEGVPSFEAVRDEMRSEVLQKKKAERFIQEMEGAEDLQSLSDAHDLEVRSVSDLTFNTNSLPGGGNEPRVIGKLLQVEEGYLTKPIEGNAGVYVAAVNRVREAGEPSRMNLSRHRQRIIRERERRVEQELFPTLKEHASVEDKRNTLR